jgi:hypothetical protein
LGCLFSGVSGVFGVEVERGRFQRFAEVRQAFLRLIRAHRFLPPRIPDLYDWRKYRRRIFGMLKTTCRRGTFLST